jgi:hypothetical protein
MLWKSCFIACVNCRLCSDGASPQERLLRLPFYSHCWPESAKRDKRLALTAAAKRQTEQEFLTEQLDSSRNTSAIDLSGLHIARGRRGGKQTRSGALRAVASVPPDEVPLGVFLFQNYRCLLDLFAVYTLCRSRRWYSLTCVELRLLDKSLHTVNPRARSSMRAWRRSFTVILCTPDRTA